MGVAHGAPPRAPNIAPALRRFGPVTVPRTLPGPPGMTAALVRAGAQKAVVWVLDHGAVVATGQVWDARGEDLTRAMAIRLGLIPRPLTPAAVAAAVARRDSVTLGSRAPDPARALAADERGFDVAHAEDGIPPATRVPPAIHAAVSADTRLLARTGAEATPTLLSRDRAGHGGAGGAGGEARLSGRTCMGFRDGPCHIDPGRRGGLRCAKGYDVRMAYVAGRPVHVSR